MTSNIHAMSPKIQRYIWTLTPIEALLFAKKEIDHAPIITEDAELYAPLFRNISVFKRYNLLIRSAFFFKFIMFVFLFTVVSALWNAMPSDLNIHDWIRNKDKFCYRACV